MAKDPKKENPLLSKNIPKPPSLAEENTPVARNDRTIEVENGKMVKRQNDTTVEGQVIVDTQTEEKATVELSLYLRPSHDDKLDELQLAYKRRTGKRIHRNDIMRKLIEKATLEDLL